MTEKTVIDSTGFLFKSTEDEEVKAISYWGNKKIQFLPEMIGETFPNMNALVARDCSIRAISKKNFEKLSKLVILDLDKNQIERIESDTFEGLMALEHLAISVNKIKYVNSRAFAVLPNLKKIWIQINPCIYDNANTPSSIAKMFQNVDAKCGFCELSKPNDIAICEITKQISDLQAIVGQTSADLKAQLQKKEEEIAKLNNKMMDLKIENVALKAETERLLRFERELKDEKERTHEQVNTATNLMKKNFDVMLEAKLQEIFNLSKELHSKYAEIATKNEEIKQYKKKNEILNGQE